MLMQPLTTGQGGIQSMSKVTCEHCRDVQMQLTSLLDGLVLAVDVDPALLHVLSNLRSAFLIKPAAATS